MPFSTVPRINLSMANNYGDLSSYQKNGIFKLNGMPGKSELNYFPCCPGVPFVRLEYEIDLQRRTVFYFIDFFMPTFILNLLLFLTYTLPPECGERMTLGISLLLAFVLHMLHVANHIPPTSDAVPMVTKFLSASTAFSAVSLIVSAIAIKWFWYSSDGSKNVPWFVRVVIDRYLAQVFCLGKQRKSSKYKHNKQKIDRSDLEAVNKLNDGAKTVDAASVGLVPRNQETADIIERLGAHSSGSYREEYSFMENFRILMRTIEGKEDAEEHGKVWRRAVCIMDRFAGLCVFVVVIITGLFLLFISTDSYIK